MTLEEIKQKMNMDREERYNNIIEYWKNRKPFKDENDIGSIPIVLPRDYKDIIVPNIIRCGGIPKNKLITGKTYIGECRNANEATWNGEKFIYKRNKFGMTYDEDINHFEEDDGHDLFVPLKIKEC